MNQYSELPRSYKGGLKVCLFLFLFFATLFVLYFIVVLCKLRGRCASLLR